MQLFSNVFEETDFSQMRDTNEANILFTKLQGQQLMEIAA